MPLELKAGDRVEGKKSDISGLQGTILQTYKKARTGYYMVRFDDGRSRECDKRAIGFSEVNAAVQNNISSDTDSSSESSAHKNDAHSNAEHESGIGSSSNDDSEDNNIELGSSRLSEGDDDLDDSDNKNNSVQDAGDDLQEMARHLAEEAENERHRQEAEMLNPHEQLWRDEGELEMNPMPGVYLTPSRLIWAGVVHDDDSLAKYFYLLFPMPFWRQTVIPLTNMKLVNRHQQPTTLGEMLKFLGLTLTMAIEPAAEGAEFYWASEESFAETVYQARNFTERFGMSRERFHQLRSSMTFNQNDNNGDPWSPIRPFIDAFNNNRKQTIIPGRDVTVDEIRSMWIGMELKNAVEAIPNLIKIARKRHGIGAEFKGICDGESNIMLAVEIDEGKDAMREKPYADKGDGTSSVLRLLSNYFGSGRVVTAASAFSSVNTLIEVSSNGLYFQGMCKNAHKTYPMQYFKKWYEDGWSRNPADRRAPGSHKLLRSTYLQNGTEKTMFALAWQDAKLKTIITNVGTTVAGEPAQKKRHRKTVGEDGVLRTETYFRQIPRPNIVCQFLRYFSIIDVHDQLRQGSLDLEESWRTLTWWHRIFATMLGVIITDCFFAYRFENRVYDFEYTANFSTFLGRLAHELVFNVHLDEELQPRNEGAAAPAAEEQAAARAKNATHTLARISTIPRYAYRLGTNSRAKLVCRRPNCKKLASYYCVACSKYDAAGELMPTPDAIFALCHSGTGRSCFCEHLLTPKNN